jgi:hypothetical protein
MKGVEATYMADVENEATLSPSYIPWKTYLAARTGKFKLTHYRILCPIANFGACPRRKWFANSPLRGRESRRPRSL